MLFAEGLLEVVKQLRANVEAAAESMVRLVEKNVFDRCGKGLPPPTSTSATGCRNCWTR